MKASVEKATKGSLVRPEKTTLWHIVSLLLTTMHFERTLTSYFEHFPPFYFNSNDYWRFEGPVPTKKKDYE